MLKIKLIKESKVKKCNLFEVYNSNDIFIGKMKFGELQEYASSNSIFDFEML
jgi:hypothetical protein